MLWRADRRTLTDRVGAVQARERGDHAVRTDRDPDIDHRRGRVDDRDARQHVALEDPVLRDRAHRGQLTAVVDPESLTLVVDLQRDHRALVLTQMIGSTSGR